MYNIAVVGATGMVGRKFLQVLEERKPPVANYYLFASKRSAGTTIEFMGKPHVVEELTDTCFDGKDIDIALFSAGGETSKRFAPVAAEKGIVVIDNSAAWRFEDDIPLVVPEVNPQDIAKYKNRGIIANPNCSTIQAVVALKPLADKYGLERVIYSTYQAVSGAGVRGFEDLKGGICGEPPQKFPYPIAGNCLPHIDVFFDDGYTKEEHKMIFETRKIFANDAIGVCATTVRVPVFRSHSESITVETLKPVPLQELREVLSHSPGVVLQDDIKNSVYPMPYYASGTDEVYVGRLREDPSAPNSICMWVVGDQLRKGAATNAVQIAQKLFE